MRQAQQWRRRVAAILEIGLQRIILRRIEIDAAKLARQIVSQIERLGAFQRVGIGCLDGEWQFVYRQTGTATRACPNFDDLIIKASAVGRQDEWREERQQHRNDNPQRDDRRVR